MEQVYRGVPEGEITIEAGFSTVTVLRFPSYPGGSDSPKAVVCSGRVIHLDARDGTLQNVTIEGDPCLQSHEIATPDLQNARIRADAVFVFSTRRAALEAYATIVNHDLAESLSEKRRLEHRIQRITAERDLLRVRLETERTAALSETA